MHKIWHKPLHKRKVWKQMSLRSKIIYYLQPLVLHLVDTWQQPLPFPTLFKIAYSGLLILLMLLPLICPIVVIISYYAIFQCLIESTLGIVYPENLDVVHNVYALFNYGTINQNQIEYLNLYLESWRYIITIFASCVDYTRLALAVLTN